ncbi:helix-turn-helix transcriptional regulator [Pseudofrankia sp. DC12]|uniref:MmyB family transcriptional regulator n=1 Tax=Pseudofrankia sp. DC12 TaxID=683315 RepID=UPI0005F78C1E
MASFLRSRRERITPQDVGMPGGARRRTPGLRREEVAQLAGVGVTWYTWLEQGRPINASAQVLGAVARTLRLDEAEREHLYRLAEVTQPAVAVVERESTPDDLRSILDGLEPLPAALVNHRSDVLGWNHTYAAMFPELVSSPTPLRNSFWFMFVTPRGRELLVNLDEQAHRAVAVFRYRYTQHLGDPEWREFVDRLCAASPLFARLWATHDVAPPGPCDKRFRLPEVGEVALRTTNLDMADLPGVRLVVYNPVDKISRERIVRLHGWPRLVAVRGEDVAERGGRATLAAG